MPPLRQQTPFHKTPAQMLSYNNTKTRKEIKRGRWKKTEKVKEERCG